MNEQLTKIADGWMQKTSPTFDDLSEFIIQTHLSAQYTAIRAVNQMATLRNWLIGCYIVEYEQKGSEGKPREQTRSMQRSVIKNPGVWVLAAASAFMYMSRYAINEWGTIFLQEAKGYNLAEAATVIGINPVFGIIGTVVSGWLSDVLFKGDRKYPALVAGVLEAIALALFLYGGPAKWVNISAMILFGIAIGVLIAFLGGLMAIDLVPRKASGAALGIVGIASYAAAGLQNVITGVLMDSNAASGAHDFHYVSIFWLGSAIISFLLPLLNWKRKPQNTE